MTRSLWTGMLILLVALGEARAQTEAVADTAVQVEGREVSAREAEGHKVERIVFVYPGEKALKSKELRSAMRVQEGGRFSRRFFNNDLAVVLDLYRGRGYRNAQITHRTLVLDRHNRLHATIELDSGPKWIVGEVSLQGGAPFAAAELRQQIHLRAGDDLDYGQVLEGERTLQIYLNEHGYPHAVVRNEWLDRPERHTADVVYHVEPGRRMYCGEITVENEGKLHTRRSLIERNLTFHRGELYNPQELSRSRNQLIRTDLFRAVTFETPDTSGGDSLQPVLIRLQERKYIRLEVEGLISAADRKIAPRVTGSVQHQNWLGRGAQLGMNGSWGRPLQGATVFLTERNLARTGADLTLSAGVSDEWTRTQVLGNPDDPRQYALLTTGDSVLEGLLMFGGEEVAREYIRTVVYDYTSIERLLQVSGTLTKSWSEIYRSHFAVNFTQARNRPDAEEDIHYTPSDVYGSTAAPDTTVGDSLFADDGWFDGGDIPNEGGQADSVGVGGADQAGRYLDYSDGLIPVNADWQAILTDRSRSVNFSAEFQRDSRDDRIAPTRGTFLRATGLYAIELGSHSTYVLDGELEARGYHHLSDRLVLALAGQVTETGSLREGRPLPQLYWKRYGGEGSLRGVERNIIQAVGGGRLGVNLRTELRYQAKTLGVVGFWDRANVWRHVGEFSLADLGRPRGMVDGYGVGLRYVVGFPFRLDVAFNDGYDKAQTTWVYFSIGQAF